MALTMILMLFSIVTLYMAAEAYISGDAEKGNYLMMAGAMGLSLSLLFLTQTRKPKLTLILKPPRVVTTIICEKCGFKKVREFVKGDYIFKKVEKCPKCNEDMIIVSIYKSEKIP